jgi:hypothetical protein
MELDLQARPVEQLQDLLGVLDHVLLGEAETVQDDDLVVEPGEVSAGVGIVPAEIPLIDRLPALEPARRKPENLVLPTTFTTEILI